MRMLGLAVATWLLTAAGMASSQGVPTKDALRSLAGYTLGSSCSDVYSMLSDKDRSAWMMAPIEPPAPRAGLCPGRREYEGAAFSKIVAEEDSTQTRKFVALSFTANGTLWKVYFYQTWKINGDGPLTSAMKSDLVDRFGQPFQRVESDWQGLMNWSSNMLRARNAPPPVQEQCPLNSGASRVACVNAASDRFEAAKSQAGGTQIRVHFNQEAGLATSFSIAAVDTAFEKGSEASERAVREKGSNQLMEVLEKHRLPKY